MEQVTLNPPKGKRWVTLPHQAPFPTPIGSLIGHTPNGDDWRVFQGHLRGNSVCVVDPNHVDSLAYMGFFGNNLFKRGVSNKGQPKHESSDVTNVEKIEAVQQEFNDEHHSHDAVAKYHEVDQAKLHSMDTDSKTEPTEDIQLAAMLKTPKLFELQDELYLMAVEAFFLSFALGCLLVTDDNNKILNLEEMWKHFSSQDSSFVYKYVAYHHFRSKGWVVKPGIKFGTTFVLYKQGPPFYHASYSVMVKPVEGESLTSIFDNPESQMSWTSLAGLNRVTEHVAKELLYCYVVQPAGLEQSDLKSPVCISKFEVQEILIRRWVSSEERAKTEEKL